MSDREFLIKQREIWQASNAAIQAVENLRNEALGHTRDFTPSKFYRKVQAEIERLWVEAEINNGNISLCCSAPIAWQQVAGTRVYETRGRWRTYKGKCSQCQGAVTEQRRDPTEPQ